MEKMIPVSKSIFVAEKSIELNPIRSSGPGGQHVNKVSTGVELRFNPAISNLDPIVISRILEENEHRLTKEGILIFNATEHRSQLKNKKAALERLGEFIIIHTVEKKDRIPVKISKAEKNKRIQAKRIHSEKKSMRRKLDW